MNRRVLNRIIIVVASFSVRRGRGDEPARANLRDVVVAGSLQVRGMNRLTEAGEKAPGMNQSVGLKIKLTHILFAVAARPICWMLGHNPLIPLPDRPETPSGVIAGYTFSQRCGKRVGFQRSWGKSILRALRAAGVR